MRLEISKEGVFIPSFNGNKDLPATDQITVRYRTPTLAMKNRCVKKPQTKGIASKDGVIESMEIVIERDSLAVFTEMLIAISNCSYKGEEKEHTVTTAGDLINAPIDFEPLLKEITNEFERILAGQEIDAKN